MLTLASTSAFALNQGGETMGNIRTLCTTAIVILMGNGYSALATVYDSNGSSANIQSIHDTQAQNGDTITLPAGAFTWTQTVNVSKNISIVGVTGQTIINDQIPKTGSSPGAFRCNLPSGATLFRISGIKFQGTVGPAYAGSLGEISLSGVSAAPNVRIDNCQFSGLYLRPIVFFGGLWGVIDHCDFTMGPWVGGIDIRHSSWKGIGDYGDNSWADDPRWGSEQAIFIEDCAFNNFSGATFIDGDGGMRVVVRHCTIFGSEAGNHGTETGQRYRSGRTFEFYQNHCDGGPSGFNHNWMIYVRGGSALVWGNYSDRYDSLVVFSEYRLWFQAAPWGQADGTNAWDVNSPTVFATGTHTGGNGSNVLVTNAHWQTNQWRAYSVRNVTRGTASSIGSNTSNTITPDGNPQGQSMTFNSGDSFEIRKINTVLDQPGRGKGDYMSGSNPAPIGWPHQASEPVHVWGNTLGPNFGNGNGRPAVYSQGYSVIQNQDWFYSSDNSAALPGYTPYVYPHPLVINQPPPSPTPSATVTPSPTSPPSPPPTATPRPSSTPTVTPRPTVTATPRPRHTPRPRPSQGPQ